MPADALSVIKEAELHFKYISIHRIKFSKNQAKFSNTQILSQKEGFLKCTVEFYSRENVRCKSFPLSNLHLFTALLLSLPGGVRFMQPLLERLQSLVLQAAALTVVLHHSIRQDTARQGTCPVYT